MSAQTDPRMVWRQIHWHRPLDETACLALLRRLSSDQRGTRLVFETRGSNGVVTFWVGCPPPQASAVANLLTTLTAGTVVTSARQRAPVAVARQVKATTRHRSFRTAGIEDSARVIHTALAGAGEDECLVLQVVLGPGRVPLSVPNNSPSSVAAPWWAVLWRGNGGPVDGEKRAALRTKTSDHGFACAVRIGVSAPSPSRRRNLAHDVLSALRTNEGPGVQLKLRRESSTRINVGARPPWGWPLRLNIAEVLAVATAWPVGDAAMPGQPPLHPRLLQPAPGTTSGRVVAVSTAPGRVDVPLRLSARNALQHLLVTSPTNAGKSTLLGRLIAQDIADGRAVCVIEPKGDLVLADVLQHVPEHRHRDVVVLDPTETRPVGLNVVHVAPGQSAEVVADGVLAVFRAMYGADAWGPRMHDILNCSLLTLARHPNTSLVMLPLLLTNTGFRRSLTQHINDPIALGPFWAWYEKLSEAERSAAIAPVMNRLRQWFLDPGLRAVVGQVEPRFDMRQVLTERKILLVPLRRGVIGNETSKLLGSLVVAQLWQAIQSRAAIPQERRHPIMVTIDEAQDYLHLGDIGEALAQSRGFGASWTLGNQFAAQYGTELKSAVLANCRSRVLFQMSHEDAVTFSKGHPEISPEDLTSLGQYEVYASLFANGKVNPYASGRTLPPSPAISDPEALRRMSRERYGRSLDEVERGFQSLVDGLAPADQLGTTGRRRRQV
ncbi:MAG: hypothetical protein JWP74_513 [Marmoricola sp.]|nr:hypothetical protein [Marmoricola sp.]